MNMAKYPERERFLYGETRLFFGILECGGESERRHVKSDQQQIFLITFRRQRVLKLKWNVMKTSRCKINLI